MIANERIGALTYYMAAEDMDSQVFVKSINQDDTWCLGTGYHEACPVEEIDFTHIDLEPTEAEKYQVEFLRGHGVIHGWIERVPDPRSEEYVDKLFVVGAWLSTREARPEMPIYKVKAVDIQCIRAPCPTHEAELVNRDDFILVHAVNLDSAGADHEAVREGYALLEGAGLLVAGHFDEIPEQGEVVMVNDILLPGARTLDAELFYTPFP